MENIKVFFISLFTCSKMEDVRMRREKNKLIKNYEPNKHIQFYNQYNQYQRLDNESDTSSIHYPNDEVYID